ncbi:hypothetical protein ACHAWX_001453 [Stephanocyclus meneghinianus]
MPAFSPIRSSGVAHWNNIVSPSPPRNTTNDDLDDIGEDDDLPIKEISFDSSQSQEDICCLGCNDQNYAPKVLEFWKVDRIPTCATCGLENRDDVLGFDIDNLCGVVMGSSTSEPKNTCIMARKSKKIINDVQYPSFLKVEKVDPVKSGFIVPPQNRGRVCSLSRAVSDLEKLDEDQPLQPSAEQHVKQEKCSLQEITEERMMERVQSLHLEFTPMKKNHVASNSVVVREEELAPSTEKTVEAPKQRYVHDFVRLPIRAGRNKGRAAKSGDAKDISQDGSNESRNGYSIDQNRFSNSRVNNQTQSTRKARISILPIRAGRVSRSHQGKNTSAGSAKHDEATIQLESELPKKGFIERRRCFIAATKTNTDSDTVSRHNEIAWIDDNPLEVSQETSIENCSDNETMKWDNKDNSNRNGKINSKLFCSESKTTKSSTSSSNASSEDNVGDASDESSSVFDEKGEGTTKITKAGWITKQMGRDGLIDSIEGVQNVELVYTPRVSQ